MAGGALRFLGNAGVAYGGFTRETERLEDRRLRGEDRETALRRQARQEELEIGALEDLRRERAYQEQMRARMMQYGAGGAQGIPAVPEPEVVATGLDGSTGLPGMPAQANMQGALADRQSFALESGRFDEAAKARQMSSEWEKEGIHELIRDLMSGADPKVSTRKYNATGKHRVDENSAKFDSSTGIYTATNSSGTTKQMNIPQLANALGIVKREKPTGFAGDSIVLGANNEVLYDGTQNKALREEAKDERAYGRAIDLQNRGQTKAIALQNNRGRLEKELAEITRKEGKASASALNQDMELLLKTGVATTPAEAFEKLRGQKGKTEQERIDYFFGQLKGADKFDATPLEEHMATATRMAKQNGGGTATPTAPVQGALRGKYKGQPGWVDPATKQFYPD